MSNFDNLKTRRDAIYTELAALDSTKPGGKPDYSVPEQSVQHVRYRMSLYEELREIDNLLALAEGPWEVRAVGFPS